MCYDYSELFLHIHAVEDLFISLEAADYLVKENVGSFVAAVGASRAADFPYTVTVVTADGTAVGKQGIDVACVRDLVHYYIHTCK